MLSTKKKKNFYKKIPNTLTDENNVYIKYNIWPAVKFEMKKCAYSILI